MELANLVVGIRLFNKEIGKGGLSLNPITNLTDHEGRKLPDIIRNQTQNLIEIT